ncbi:MAG: protease [Acidocella sp. 20-57-95]|nr:MAG: protease [Acidocella sp. 20-57-95]
MAALTGRKIAIFIENNHNDHEVWYPFYRLREAGAEVSIVGPELKNYTSKLGQIIKSDITAQEAQAHLYDALVIPGGYAPDLMRLCPPMVSMVTRHVEAGKVVAAICHGCWLLASAHVLQGKRVTGAPSIKDDLTNAGGVFEDSEVVVDGVIISSRKPEDLPAFCRKIVAALQ